MLISRALPEKLCRAQTQTLEMLSHRDMQVGISRALEAHKEFVGQKNFQEGIACRLESYF